MRKKHYILHNGLLTVAQAANTTVNTRQLAAAVIFRALRDLAIGPNSETLGPINYQTAADFLLTANEGLDLWCLMAECRAEKVIAAAHRILTEPHDGPIRTALRNRQGHTDDPPVIVQGLDDIAG